MADVTDTPRRNPVAKGVSVLAGVLLLVSGVAQVLHGIAVIANDAFLVKVDDYLYALSGTAFGWVHLILGIATAVVGCFILMARPWALVVGMVLAIINILQNLVWMAFDPLQAFAMIALNVLVVWGLATSRTDANRAY
jgi:hypothetical protein